MADNIKKQTAHVSVGFVPADVPVDPEDMVNPEDAYGETTDASFTRDIDRGGLYSNMTLTCVSNQPVNLGAVATLALRGISSLGGLVPASSCGTLTVSASRIPETKTDVLSFVGELAADLSALPVSGTISYAWIGRAPAVDRVVFDGRRVTLAAAFTGLLRVTYTALYHELQLSGINEEPDGGTAGEVFDVLTAVSYGDCSASCTVEFQDLAETECDQGYQDGYADGYTHGQQDTNAGDDYGTSYDATGYDSTQSDIYVGCFGDGYADGYNDGYSGDQYDDDQSISYSGLTLRVLDCCTREPVDGANVVVDGVSQGTTGANGTIQLSDVTVGDSLRITHPDYIDSDKDALNNDRIPRVNND